MLVCKVGVAWRCGYIMGTIGNCGKTKWRGYNMVQAIYYNGVDFL